VLSRVRKGEMIDSMIARSRLTAGRGRERGGASEERRRETVALSDTRSSALASVLPSESAPPAERRRSSSQKRREFRLRAATCATDIRRGGRGTRGGPARYLRSGPGSQIGPGPAKLPRRRGKRPECTRSAR